MDLGDLGDFLDSSFNFTLDGRSYTVAPVAWPVYLEMLAAQEHYVAVSEGRAKAEDGPEDLPVYKTAPVVLGPVLDELIAAGVPGPRIIRIARAAYLFQVGEPDAARFVIEGKAPPRAASTSTTPTGSTGTGAATSTRRRGSTSSTTSQTTSPKPNAPAPR